MSAAPPIEADPHPQILAIRLDGQAKAINHLLGGRPGQAEYALAKADLREANWNNRTEGDRS